MLYILLPLLFGGLKFFEFCVYLVLIKMVSHTMRELFHGSRKKLVIGKRFKILKVKKPGKNVLNKNSFRLGVLAGANILTFYFYIFFSYFKYMKYTL